MSEKGMIFYVTTPDVQLAEKIGNSLVEKKIAACVQIIQGITSIYTWKGELNKDKECLLIIKTTPQKADELIEYIEKNHSYEVPECVGVAIEKGSEKYMKWLTQSTI